MRVIVIEDEQLMAEDLVHTLKQILPQVQILAMLRSIQETLNFFESNPEVDLIFSDIQLGDGLSFEIFDRLRLDVPIVFCTAYDDYLLHAFKTNGIDYILKPISHLAIKATMDKYFKLRKGLSREQPLLSPSSDDYQSMIAQVRTKPTSILVHQKDKIIPLHLQAIALFYIEFENVFVKTFEGKDYPVMKTLDELEKLVGEDFFRANRQHLLSREIVSHARYSLSRKLALDLSIRYKSRIYVSKEKAKSFLCWLENQQT